MPLSIVGCGQFKAASGHLDSASTRSLSKLYSQSAVTFYLSNLSSTVVGRPLSQAELSLIQGKRQEAISEIVNTWMDDAYLADSARLMTNINLSASGTADGVNYNLPGNLAKYIVKNRLPYSQILKADYCVADDLNKTACDTGAPYVAGVLTTRAYMKKNVGRFNLRRAGKLLKEFACREYPMETTIQRPLDASRLIPMFQVLEGSKDMSFGNGQACYSCHSQFGAHAQLFVKFDTLGKYVPEATGIQASGVEKGLSTGNLYASHLQNPVEAASESSQMFSREVRNLKEAADVLAESPLFLECAIRKVLKHFLRLDASDAERIGIGLIQEIATQIRSEEPDPTFQTIVNKSLIHPLVIESVLKQGEAP
ncbi:MAG: hypothetical protein AB7G93_02470 [Bdellovibrionales bacterium]